MPSLEMTSFQRLNQARDTVSEVSAGRLTLVLLLGLSISAVGGCGGDEASGGGSGGRNDGGVRLTEVERVAEVVRKQSAAIAAGDGERACGYFSTKARRELEALARSRLPELPLACVDIVGEVAGRLTDGIRSALRVPTLTSVTVNGDRAEATLEPPQELVSLVEEAAGKRATGSATPLRKIGGEWRIDALAF